MRASGEETPAILEVVWRSFIHTSFRGNALKPYKQGISGHPTRQPFIYAGFRGAYPQTPCLRGLQRRRPPATPGHSVNHNRLRRTGAEIIEQRINRLLAALGVGNIVDGRT